MSIEKSVQEKLREKLSDRFKPTVLDLTNESQRHHSPPGAESHFKLVMVSAEFSGLSRLKRQQSVYNLLKIELATDIHALTMKLMSPEEWAVLPENERKFRAIGHHPAGNRKPQ